MGYPPLSPESTLSERLYRLLLLAYPRAFREEYASEMLLVFRDAYREAMYWQGTLGVLRLWRDFFFDFVKSACIEHGRNWIQRGGRDFALAGKEQLAMTLQFTLDIAQRTDIGRTRANNEDNLISVVPEDSHLLQTRGALFVVSDGMGGHTRGEVASELAIEKVKEYYYQDLQHDIPTALQEAMKRASVVALLVEHGEITPAEARTHEKRNQIYRAFGIPDVKVDLFTEPVQEGDTLILRTDGLCGVVDDNDLRAIIEQYGPEESVEHLIARANEAGGPDNVTAIVVRISAA